MGTLEPLAIKELARMLGDKNPKILGDKNPKKTVILGDKNPKIL